MTSPATTLARQTGLAHATEADAALKPPLKSALGSLNVRLDDELMRYRRQRAGHAAPEPKRLPLKKTAKRPLDLIAVNSTSAAEGQRPTPPPPPPNPFITPSSAAAGADAAAVPVAAPNESTLIPHPQKAQPQDYLESSADLLRSLADGPLPPEPAAVPPTAQNNGLFGLPMPLGIGVLMLLLLGSGGLGYLLINPAAVSHLRQHPLLVSLGLGTAPTEIDDPAMSSPSGTGLGMLNPDLSQKEFVELNLSSLTTLDVGSNQVPSLSIADLAPIAPDADSEADPDGAAEGAAAEDGATDGDSAAQAPAPTSAPTAAAPQPTAPAPAPQAAAPAPAPQAAAPAPAPAPAPQAAAPAPQTAAAPRTNYYVVADYTGDQSLDAARGVVGDAYVRNFDNGARIQLGAFDSEASARQWVQDLQNQGISARVQTP